MMRGPFLLCMGLFSQFWVRSGDPRLGAMLLPEFNKARVKWRPGASSDRHLFPIATGGNHEAFDSEQRAPPRRVACRRPFGAIATGDLATPQRRPAANHVDCI